MSPMNTDVTETVARLRKHPVYCMDGQNITKDAADEIESSLKAIVQLYDIAKSNGAHDNEMDKATLEAAHDAYNSIGQIK